jgi:uncharacterized protein (TIGR03435 family)
MIGQLTNHLWQSTLFAAAAGLLTLAFRNNGAKVRYWLWFSASVKFFVPFALLMSLGSHLGWAPSAKAVATPAVSLAVKQIAQPFPDAFPPAPVTPRRADWRPISLAGLWACGFASVAAMRIRSWRRIRSALRSSAAIDLPAAVEVRSAPGLLEPGVVGLLRPILLLPAGIAERLTPPQLEAVLAHELSHIRRRDNLLASVHMMVEALFWFHPLVWWIGARLLEERERACDEEVLRLGSEPHVYAEGILNVCKLYLESPLACACGVTGSNLRKRIEAVMANRTVYSLGLGRKLLLAIAGATVLAGPVVTGLLYTPTGRAQAQASRPEFEVASVKPTPPGTRDFRFRPTDHGIDASNVPLDRIILFAYNLKNVQLTGGPDWIHREDYDIAAKSPANAPGDQIRPVLQALLANRFKLAVHHETKVLSVYALVPGKGKSKLHEVKEPRPDDGTFRAGRGHLSGQGVTMQDLAEMLAGQFDGIVVNQTGLTGKFDIALEWTPDMVAVGGNDREPAPDPSGPSLVTALSEQLGLELKPSKGPVDILVIDRVEKPSEN